MVVTLLLRAQQTKQTIKPDYTTRTHLQTLLTDLPIVLRVGRLLSPKVRNKLKKNQSEKIY